MYHTHNQALILDYGKSYSKSIVSIDNKILSYLVRGNYANSCQVYGGHDDLLVRVLPTVVMSPNICYTT